MCAVQMWGGGGGGASRRLRDYFRPRVTAARWGVNFLPSRGENRPRCAPCDKRDSYCALTSLMLLPGSSRRSEERRVGKEWSGRGGLGGRRRIKIKDT